MRVKIVSFLALVFLVIAPASAKDSDELLLEKLIRDYSKNLNPQDYQELESEEGLFRRGDNMKKKAFIICNWDRVFEKQDPQSSEKATQQLAEVSLKSFPAGLRLKGLVLKKKLGLPIEKEERDFSDHKWTKADYWAYLSLKENYSEFLDINLSYNKSGDHSLWDLDFKNAIRKDEWSDSQRKSLLNFEPNWRRRLRGYKDQVRLYMFCRHNREQPCLVVMKDAEGKWHRNSSGKLWSQPKLGLSRLGLPAHQVNGDTPQGIYTIDSVMPEANRQLVFGKYRRLILNFISQSRKEKDFKSLMPKETQNLSWWQEGMVARDVGRSLLRIHGTGVINKDPASSWYPFYPTVGCIASRENLYDGVEFHDQRELLDEMMKASGLSRSYANEVRLKGLLYVVDIDSQEKPVGLQEIEKLISL